MFTYATYAVYLGPRLPAGPRAAGVEAAINDATGGAWLDILLEIGDWGGVSHGPS